MLLDLHTVIFKRGFKFFADGFASIIVITTIVVISFIIFG